MVGAITGDIIGSIYERYNIKTKNFIMFEEGCTFTDDSVLTCAISRACIEYNNNKDMVEFKKNCKKYMQKYGRNHINAGYGGNFIRWLLSSDPQPYNSYGNGSAMRVSSVGWIAEDLEEAECLAEASASVSHNHPEGIKGAQAVAGSIWLLRNGYTKKNIEEYITQKYYDLDFLLDDIRSSYTFDVSCQGSVPQAIKAFLEADSFEDCIRNAISIGGDSDTIAAIAGSLAEAYYGIPKNLKERVLSYLDKDLLECVKDFEIIKKEKTFDSKNTK